MRTHWDYEQSYCAQVKKRTSKQETRRRLKLMAKREESTGGKSKEQKAETSERLRTGGPAEKSGRPGKAPHHEGEAGKGEKRDIGGSKWQKEERDSVSEKEPGKSRGPGG